MPGKERGTIEKLVPEHGYGFISRGSGKANVFFHVSGLVDRGIFSRLQPGWAVTYDLEEHPKGLRATNMEVVEG